jgi:SsrA-binding protein
MAKSTSKPTAPGGNKQKANAKKEAVGALVCDNKKARFEYEVLDTFEAGLVLRGTEVKVLRQGRMSLDEAHARVHEGEVFLIGAHIDEYTHGNIQNHEPKRRRKCLMHKREIRKLKQEVDIKGLTLVPLRVYFGDRGFAKVTLAICKGRKTRDKRVHIKEREARRELRNS